MSASKPFRYTNELVGALVLLLFVLFAAAIVQTGRLRDWFEPDVELNVILPEAGLFGLSRGAKVEILGTPAGTVKDIVVVPGQRIHAVVALREKMTGFVRSDSQAIIRKEFGVAGAAFMEITSGQGAPLDWEYAVIYAKVERAPTESVGEILAELRAKMMPILDQVQQVLGNLNTITGTIAGGQGAIGRLLVEDKMALEVETLLGQVNRSVGQLGPVLESLKTTIGNLATLSEQIAGSADEFPMIRQDAGEILASLQSVMADLQKTTPQLPGLVENVNTVTSDVPVLLMQTQQALSELTVLLQQLQSHWLLGGGRPAKPAPPERISPLEVTP